jgi:hypothetical protein
MTTEEMKKELQQIIANGDEALTNVLMEAVVEYQKSIEEASVVPKEWIEEANEVSKAIKNGSMQINSLQEIVEQTKHFFKDKYHVEYTPDI